MINLLNEADRDCLVAPERHETSYMFSYKDPRTCKIVVDIDARPLLSLVEAAFYGNRVYEFMTIQRPGDLLHYLWVTFVELDEELLKSLKASVDYKYPYQFDMKKPLNGLPFIYFDEKFFWQGDDTGLSDAAWRDHIDQESWYQKLSRLYQLVCKLQLRLREVDDFLLKNELRLIDEKKHRRDFFNNVKRSCILDTADLSPQAQFADFYKALGSLITQDDVHSVSCPFSGFQIWRVLVKEQVQRSQRLNLPLQDALHLYGPDSGLDKLPEDWGGEVRIPYEGMFDADVVFLPGWRVFHTEKAGTGGSLARALKMKHCRYVFVPKIREIGELACATREEIDGWVLYRQKQQTSFSDANKIYE